jgi:hypothetical protein
MSCCLPVWARIEQRIPCHDDRHDHCKGEQWPRPHFSGLDASQLVLIDIRPTKLLSVCPHTLRQRKCKRFVVRSQYQQRPYLFSDWRKRAKEQRRLLVNILRYLLVGRCAHCVERDVLRRTAVEQHQHWHRDASCRHNHILPEYAHSKQVRPPEGQVSASIKCSNLHKFNVLELTLTSTHHA